MLASSILILGQTGMGTPTPRGALDINRPLTNTFGLVLPTNDDTANHCTLNLNGNGGIILSYVARITDLGDLQYYCVLARKSSTARPSAPDIEKFLAFCNDPEPPTNFVPPGTPPSNT